MYQDFELTYEINVKLAKPLPNGLVAVLASSS